MVTAQTSDTPVVSHNRINKVELNADGTNDELRAFTITDKDGISGMYYWRVPYSGGEKDVDAVFRKMKTRVCPYADLRCACAMLAKVMDFCEKLPRLKAQERRVLIPVRRLHNCTRERIGLAAEVKPSMTNPSQVNTKRMHIEEAKGQFDQVADTLKYFVTRPELCSENMITAETRDMKLREVDRAILVFGLVAMMFEKGLFI